MTKLRVGLIFGGRSVEHEVSIASAQSIFQALDPARYEVHLIAVDPNGRWHLAPPSLPPQAQMADGQIRGEEVQLCAVPGQANLIAAAPGDARTLAELDVVFPIIHGRGGEDGSLQGLLELTEIAYVGSGVLGSSLQMDKEVSKRLLAAAGVPVLPWRTVRAKRFVQDTPRVVGDILEAFEVPLFVKPANLGSSVGIHRVTKPDDLEAALCDALRYDPKLLVEPGVPNPRDVEVAVIDGDHIEASIPGEIRTGREFYDYEAKYVDEGTELLVPASISNTLSEQLREAAITSFEALEGHGLGRVDFLIEGDSDRFYVNEVNSLPGFTEVSMYPRLWEASGLPYPAMLDRLIELALERRRERHGLETQYRRK